MEQENEVQTTELKEEKSKKIFIILIVLLLFGGTCYYYSGINNIPQPKLAKIEQAKTVLQKEKKPAQIELEKIQKAEKKPEIAKTEETTPKTKFKPTDKSSLLSLAGQSSGKHDPFSYSESQFMPTKSGTGENSVSYPSNLPPVPMAGSTGTLPSLPGFNSLSPSGLANPPAPKPEDLVTVKGFIGNKVIVEIDGIVEALNTNEKVSNVKVLAVNPSLLTARFEIDGKPVTKTIKSLTDDYNGDVQLVKNIHNQ
jgi:hypothetical protein